MFLEPQKKPKIKLNRQTMCLLTTTTVLPVHYRETGEVCTHTLLSRHGSE